MKKSEIDSILMPPPRSLAKSRIQESSEGTRRNIMRFFDITSSIGSKGLGSTPNLSFINKKIFFHHQSTSDDNLVDENDDIDISTTNLNTITSFNNNLYQIPKYNKLPPPSSKQHIKIFVQNILYYLSNFLYYYNSSISSSDSIFFLSMKMRIETRFNDYRNKGLEEGYFIKKLVSEQEELINKVTLMNKAISSDEPNTNYNPIGSIEYSMLQKKRKRDLLETKSILSCSSSDEE